MTETQDGVVITRRGASAERFLPREAAAETTVVARNVLRPREGRRSETSRERKIAGDLPAWEPMPPGELVVKRVK